MEKEHRGAAVAAAMRERAAAGTHVNRTPLGYRREGAGKRARTVPDEPAAELIREAFGMVTAGVSLRQALAILTGRGLTNRNGKPLSLSSLHLVLTSPFYTGRIVFQGKSYEGSHEALVDSRTFTREQVTMGRNRR